MNNFINKINHTLIGGLMDRTSKIAIAVLLFFVAIMFGYLAIVDFSANSNPSMGHVYTLVYIFGSSSAIFIISAIWLVVSSVRQTKNKEATASS
jgi:hypothetical protein